MAESSNIQPVPKRWSLLAACMVLCQFPGIIGALGMRDAAIWTWYQALAKPPITPPGWVFGPVWTILYALMGIALWMAIRHAGTSPIRHTVIGVFMLQLALNAAWSPLFFGFQSIGGALIDIVLLLAAIVATMIVFGRIHRTAAWLLAPYVAWVAFATALNAWLWVLNAK